MWNRFPRGRIVFIVLYEKKVQYQLSAHLSKVSHVCQSDSNRVVVDLRCLLPPHTLILFLLAIPTQLEQQLTKMSAADDDKKSSFEDAALESPCKPAQDPSQPTEAALSPSPLSQDCRSGADLSDPMSTISQRLTQDRLRLVPTAL